MSKRCHRPDESREGIWSRRQSERESDELINLTLHHKAKKLPVCREDGYVKVCIDRSGPTRSATLPDGRHSWSALTSPYEKRGLWGLCWERTGLWRVSRGLPSLEPAGYRTPANLFATLVLQPSFPSSPTPPPPVSLAFADLHIGSKSEEHWIVGGRVKRKGETPGDEVQRPGVRVNFPPSRKAGT